MTINDGHQRSSAWRPAPWTLLPIAALAGAVLAVVAGAIWLAIARIDDAAVSSSSRLAMSAVRSEAESIAKWVKDYAFWDATAENILESVDDDWAYDNIGQYMSDSQSVAATIVVDRDDRVVFAVSDENREPFAADEFEAIVAELSFALAQARATPMVEPDGVYCLVQTAQGLALAGLAAITPEQPTAEQLVPAPRPVLVYLRLLDEEWLAGVERQYQLTNPRIENDPALAADHALILFRSDGSMIAALEWDPPRPGLGAFHDFVLPAAVALLVIFGLLVVVVRRALMTQGVVLQRAQELADANARLVEGDQQVRSALQRAEHATRSKTAFLARVSHEIRTPLTAIVGFSQILKLQHRPDGAKSREQEYSEIIYESSQHLLALVNDLLDLSKIESGGFEMNESWVDVGRELTTVRTVLSAEADRKGVAVGIEMPEDVPALYADAKSIRQILTNLAANALKFTDRGGRVDLRLSVTGDGGMAIDVDDTGAGIPPEDLKGIWEPFTRARSPAIAKAEGAGLGLHLVKVLCDLHDAEIDLASEVGKGTRIRVTFGADRVRSIAF